jgi:sugar/nucleoside kinase (ribokinase family)
VNRVLPLVDMLRTDAVEGEQLSGYADLRAAARALSGPGACEMVLTHCDGLLVYGEGRYHEAGFFPRKLIGRGGRGDTNLASYLARRLTHSPAEATIWAAALTSLKTEDEGSLRGELRDIKEFVRHAYL